MIVPLDFSISEEEILEDLCWPGLPPGRWQIPDDRGAPPPRPQRRPRRERRPDWRPRTWSILRRDPERARR